MYKINKTGLHAYRQCVGGGWECLIKKNIKIKIPYSFYATSDDIAIKIFNEKLVNYNSKNRYAKLRIYRDKTPVFVLVKYKEYNKEIPYRLSGVKVIKTNIETDIKFGTELYTFINKKGEKQVKAYENFMVINQFEVENEIDAELIFELGINTELIYELGEK